MSSFSLVIEYLTGYAVATDASSRERPEWPPHPARVYMALAAAHFETEPDNAAQREALEWLAALDPPDLVIPNHALPRDVLSVFVPVNDKLSGGNVPWRSRQPRTFPRVHVGGDPVRLIYRVNPDVVPDKLDALETVCRNVTRIGHSSSLVWVRLERGGGEHRATHRHQPDGITGAKVRTPYPLMLKTLTELYGEAGRAEHARLVDELATVRHDLGTLKGTPKTQAKRREAELKTLVKRDPRPPIRPAISHTSAYVEADSPPPGVTPSVFDPNFIVLKAHPDATQRFGLESTAQFTAALRGAIMSTSATQPVPAWVSGHKPDGGKLDTGRHIALIPLAFVGRHWINAEQHATGHLLGMGILIPRDIKASERAKVFSPLLFDDRNRATPVDLKTTAGLMWKLLRDDDFNPRLTLRTDTYTAVSRSWASVTPVLLDKMPKADRRSDPAAWREEVSGIIADSCIHVGLPQPVVIRVEKTPLFLGSLRAMPGQGGFPQLRRDKFQVHANVVFDQPVQGPLLLGAGRFRGYGLFRPWQQPEETR